MAEVRKSSAVHIHIGSWTLVIESLSDSEEISLGLHWQDKELATHDTKLTRAELRDALTGVLDV